ncbi:MAG: HD domain-containing protein [Acidobacteria bacterium]|nr:HD domain-containing protein [Acidobacteriota bacterium]
MEEEPVPLLHGPVMPRSAQAYILLTILIGLAALAAEATNWRCDDPLQFAAYCALAVLASRWKVVLPGIQGTMSVNCVVVMIGISQLSPGEAVAMAFVSTLFQCLWKAKAVDPVKIAFSLASIAISVLVTGAVLASPFLENAGLGVPLRLLLASLAYFVTNTGQIALAISATSRRGFLGVWRQNYFWSFPYYLAGAGFTAGFNWVSASQGWQASVLILPFVYLVSRSYGLHVNELRQEKERAEVEREHARQMADLHFRTVEALALAIEAKDQTTHNHLRRVQVYCVEVGKELKLPQPEMDALVAASLLHDIGKLAVPEHIIAKPAKLTAEEFEKMKTHPVVGAQILDRVKFPYPVVPVVRHHHEKWDGTGYPDGLKGKEIPVGARILAAVDCLDALASHRQYRPALPIDDAIATVKSMAGRAFDPEIVGRWISL